MECELEFSFFLFYFSFLLLPVYHVNWMRARAQKNRWDEELMKTEKEMLWVTLYFMHHRDLWYDRLVRPLIVFQTCHLYEYQPVYVIYQIPLHLRHNQLGNGQNL